MDFSRFANYLRFQNLKNIFLLTVFWATTCYIVFLYDRFELQIPHDSSNLGRELLQQEPIDYIHYSTTTQVMNQSKKMMFDAKLNVDEGSRLNEKEHFKVLSKNSNLPFSYWFERKSRKTSDSMCLKFPSLYDLDFNNIYWQRLTTLNSTFYLFGAYYDERSRVGTLPLVRILGMVDKTKPQPTFCQFWYDNVSKTPESLMFSKTSYTYMWNNKWGNYKDGILQPFIISCVIPKIESASHIPASVSLVGKQCEQPTNNLRVIYYKPEIKKNFAVCVKGLDFLYNDISVKLVEWIELLHLLGAEKIFMYELEIHPNISKILSYYVDRGIVELTRLTLPGEQPNLPGLRHLYLKSKVVTKRQNELIPYNDCLYKNLYSYNYIALLDTDEVIMPLVHDNWKDMMDEIVDMALEVRNYTRASYNFRNVYFLDSLQNEKEIHDQIYEESIPRYMHILQHIYRSKNYTKPGYYVKCFHNTDRVVSLHNHFPLNCFGQCTTYSVNTSLAHMQHYRKDCVDSLKKSCNDFKSSRVRDTTVWRYKDELIRRTTETLSHLDFFKDTKIHKQK